MFFTETVPWTGIPFIVYLRGIVSKLFKNSVDEITKECLKILYSNRSNDEIQYPLIELLGDSSFDDVSLFLDSKVYK